MKKKLLFLIPMLLGMVLSACDTGGSNPPSDTGSGSNPPSNDSSGAESEPTSSSSLPITQYTITFKDETGNTLESKKWDEGTTPFYHYEKDDTVEWDYTVDGWSLTINGEVLSILPQVSANATYYAIVSKVKQKYTITFESNGGSDVASITEDYGTLISEPTKPTKKGYKFVGWSTDSAGSKKVTWPFTLTKNETFYANWNEKVGVLNYIQYLLTSIKHDPYSYIPANMRQENSANHVTEDQVDYNFETFKNVSDIKYGGFGEQWHMVVENIEQSELFYSVLAAGETVINTSVVLFNNFFDDNPDDTASHTLKETTYTAKLNFDNGILTYSLQYKTNLNIPFFGDVIPQIDMVYNVKTLEKTVRIQLNENNAMKYVVTDNSYVFALEYGVDSVSRKAYFQLNRLQDKSVQGHIYEFIQYKDKDLVASCADFYIDDTYTSVVGNKASGLIGFKGYINELYKTNEGKLLGYEVRETLTVLGVSGQYNTLWFNLNDIEGINSVKAIENENNTGTYTNKNPHDIYLNDDNSIFEPKYNKKLGVETSRKYDVELRKQYFYGYDADDKLVEYETNTQ